MPFSESGVSMQAITDFLSGIGDAILAVIDFVIGFFSDLIFMIQMRLWISVLSIRSGTPRLRRSPVMAP